MSQQINLYNPAFRKQKKPFAAVPMAWLLLVITVGSVTLYAYSARQTGILERALKETDVRLVVQRQQTTRLATELAPAGGALIVDELARAESRLAARRELLRGITTGVSANAEGYSGLMTALARRATEGLWLTGFSVSESTSVAIKGRVLDAGLVPAYIRALNNEEAMRGRSVSELKMTARSGQEAAAKPPAGKAPAPERTAPARYVEFSVALTPKQGETGNRQ